MDAPVIDALTRALATAGSRRAALTVLAAALGLRGLTHPEVAAAKKKCPPCKKRNKRGKCKKKQPDLTPCGGGRTCRGGVCACPVAECGGACVDTSSDPRNCGNCGTRCQLNATCQGGTCSCVQGACPASDGGAEGTCCPVEFTQDICRCAPPDNIDGEMIDPTTCFTVRRTGPDACPEAQQCIGPNCMACCPVGATCDPTTGTCLR